MAEAALRDDEDAPDVDVVEDMARYEAARRGARVSHESVRAWLASRSGDAPLSRPEPSD